MLLIYNKYHICPKRFKKVVSESPEAGALLF
jgi:hypothetical protein